MSEKNHARTSSTSSSPSKPIDIASSSSSLKNPTPPQKKNYDQKDSPPAKIPENFVRLDQIDLNDKELNTSSPVIENFFMDESSVSGSLHGANSTLHVDITNGKEAISSFLKKFCCYDMMVDSGKVVVFDKSIPIRLAYFALVEHHISAAPLYDATEKKIDGIIAVSDFIQVLRYGHITSSVSEIIDNHSLSSWQALVQKLRESPDQAESLIEQQVAGVQAAKIAANSLNGNEIHPDAELTCSRRRRPRSLISLSPDDSLFTACQLFRKHRIHRLPVVDAQTQTCLAVLTHLTILQYLVREFKEKRKLFDYTVGDLGIGTFSFAGGKVISCQPDTPLIEVLELLATNGISCVPVVDENGEVIEVYSRTNVTYLVSKDVSLEECLTMSVCKVLKVQNGGDNVKGKDLHTCRSTDTLLEVFRKFANARAHRLICVDDNRRLIGIVSLSDLLSYFLD